MFKMGTISLSSLKQCFYDSDVRINNKPRDVITYPRIISVACSQGFLANQSCILHEDLNSIIGGKGVGKSLIVDFTRFALDQFSPSAEIKGDMDSKLDKQLRIGGKVIVNIQTGALEEFQVTREYDGINKVVSRMWLKKESACPTL